ncbi:NAD(P)-dependent oxidoreductase [Rossellomorea vietnamensis]|uniref:NAD(P)-dependent oxidoreductase n=1 Tax=Rossellomorea vietnamensis TaxID=218284 RepID=A0A5D4M1V5_9BACI|nr:NAD(P)-dependent oxidoreductase [Rossellomorea vietnamensis]TYR95165.1 NAD(P)-dependent oxidoreductase [Rossellomorea vietnamensis]
MNTLKVGFIGTGVMGKSIAFHLLQKYGNVSIYTRTKEKAGELLNAGAEWSESPAELASTVDILFSIVGYPQDVSEIYLGEKGILRNGKKGLIAVDMTTSKPMLAQEIYNRAKSEGIHTLDAPVSGGDTGAKNGTLSIMVGGDEAVYEKALPYMQAFGSNIRYHGRAGSGQHTKMANQIAIASNMIGVCEALVYAKKAGLDLEDVLKTISGGAAGSWSLSNLAPRMVAGDFEPGFYVKHFIKDMGIALEEAELMGLSLPGLSLAKELYEELSSAGAENDGTQALIKLWKE